MKKTAQPATTQAFTAISDIRDDIVLLQDGTACIVIKVNSVNFALLSGDEQDAKVFAYAALLNSLSFPVQILVRSKPIQISPYLLSIDTLAQKTTNTSLKQYMLHYRAFVASLVQTTSVLDKQFYIVISYSTLEGGVGSVLSKKALGNSQDNFFHEAQSSLETKAESLLSQVHRLSLQATILQKGALIKLFYEIYNQGEKLTTTNEDIENPIVTGNSA